MEQEHGGRCDSRSRSPRSCRETPAATAAATAAAPAQQESCREDWSRSPRRDAASSTAGVLPVEAADATMLQAADVVSLEAQPESAVVATPEGSDVVVPEAGDEVPSEPADGALRKQQTLQELLQECVEAYGERPSPRVFMKLHTAMFSVFSRGDETTAAVFDVMLIRVSKSTAAKLVDDTFMSELRALQAAVRLVADSAADGADLPRALLRSMRSGRRRLYILQCMWALHKELRSNLDEPQSLGDEPFVAVRACFPAMWPRLVSHIVRGRLEFTTADLFGLVAVAARFGRCNVLGERLRFEPRSLDELEGMDRMLRLHVALQLFPRARRFLVHEIFPEIGERKRKLSNLVLDKSSAAEAEDSAAEPSAAEPEPLQSDMPASKRRSPMPRERWAPVSEPLQLDMPAAQRLTQQAPSIWATIVMRWLPKETLFEIGGLYAGQRHN